MKNLCSKLMSCTCFLLYNMTAQAMTLSIDSGSYWCADNISPGFHCPSVATSIVGFNGIITGETQLASGSHSGLPDGSETPNIDQPWEFFGNTGMHMTTSPVTILSRSSDSMLLDFSGWAWTWNGIQMPLGTGSWLSNPEGVAVISCGVDCGDGDRYSLAYSATIPQGYPYFGGIHYGLFIEGVISTVPVPAAIWLFLSGGIALLGFSRSKKYSCNIRE